MIGGGHATALHAQFFNRPSVTHEMQIMSLQVRHGVKQDVLELKRLSEMFKNPV
jgi:hypothetical protein